MGSNRLKIGPSICTANKQTVFIRVSQHLTARIHQTYIADLDLILAPGNKQTNTTIMCSHSLLFSCVVYLHLFNNLSLSLRLSVSPSLRLSVCLSVSLTVSLSRTFVRQRCAFRNWCPVRVRDEELHGVRCKLDRVAVLHVQQSDHPCGARQPVRAAVALPRRSFGGRPPFAWGCRSVFVCL